VSRRDVIVIILHAHPGPNAGPLTQALAAARLELADRHRRGFVAAGAREATVVAGPPDNHAFGTRLRAIAAGLGQAGLVVLGSGAIPLATAADRRTFVETAGAVTPQALANNRYSADIVAIARAGEIVANLPDDLATDNALPRWLDEVAGIPVADLRRRWRLAIDLDGPLDLALLGGRWRAELPPGTTDRVDVGLARWRTLAADRRAELAIAGRTSAGTLGWLEGHAAARVRALVEERGLRTSRIGQRPPSSVLGLLLDRDGPGSLGRTLARLADGAIVDSRVLLAHRLGADEAGWPPAEDRFASDLLLHEQVADPWLRELTQAAAEAPIPVLLGGHTLVGPGVRLALRSAR
jgi:hypothetical protein